MTAMGRKRTKCPQYAERLVFRVCNGMIEPILTWDAHARSIDDGYMGSISRMTKDLINFMIAKNLHSPQRPHCEWKQRKLPP